jgi:sortase A
MTDVVVLPRPSEREPEVVSESSSAEPEETPSPRFTGRDVAQILAWGLTLFGVAVVSFAVYLVGVTRLEHGRSQRALTEQFDAALANKAAPIGGRIDEGTPVATLSIPRFGMHETVVEGTSGSELKKGPGHLRSSPLPLQGGNAVVACRRLTYGGPCYDLVSMKAGDRIRFVTGQGKGVYRVTEVRGVRRGDTDVLSNTTRNQLTLISSQRLLADRRVAVIARLVGAPTKTAPGRPTEVRSSELGLNREGGSVLALVLWLQALLLACLLTVWLFRKQSPVAVYLVMAPVLLLLTLLVFDSFAVLLPSTL